MKKNKFLIHRYKLHKLRYKLKSLNINNNYILVVYRTNKHIYAQIINLKGIVQVSASSLELLIKNININNKKQIASIVGKTIASRALNKNIRKIIFDRSGYIYHGRIKCLAEAARTTGLIF